jgi:hypothetical protein
MFVAEAMKPHCNRKGGLHTREKITSYQFEIVFTLMSSLRNHIFVVYLNRYPWLNLTYDPVQLCYCHVIRSDCQIEFELDLFTAYTHYSELYAITKLLLICALYSSRLHTHQGSQSSLVLSWQRISNTVIIPVSL